MKKIHYLLMVIFPLIFSSITAALPFQNGSFETGPALLPPWDLYVPLYAGDTSITGWTVTYGSVENIGPYWVASDGSRSIDLNGFYQQGGIEQSFDTTIGQEYIVSFDLSGNFTSGVDPKTMTVDVALFSKDYSFYKPISWSQTNMGWVTYTFEFTAQANSSTLRFNSTTGNATDAWGPALDNVTVTSVPEPATMILLGSGLLGLWGARRKFKK